MKNCLGIFIMALPFIAIVVFMVYYNFAAFMIALGILAVIVICVYLGLLIMD